MACEPRTLREAQRVLREASLELARLYRIRGASHRTWRRIARARGRLSWAAGALAVGLSVPASAADPSFRAGFVLPSVTDWGGASPAFADLDGDGDLDLYVGIWDGTTQILLNTGSATAPAFAAGSATPFTDVGSYAAPTFADVDGDGDVDAFIGSYGGNIVFLENTGTTSAPGLAAPVTNPFGLGDVGFLAAPAFGDLDADGDLDALVGEAGGNVVYFPNTGSASAPAFGPPATNPFGLADVGTGATPELVDIDGDGDLDVLAGKYGGGVPGFITLFRNTGSASTPAFTASSAAPFGLGTYGGNRLALAFGDVDGDGDYDGVVTGQNGEPIPFMFSSENTGSASAPSFTDAGNPFGLDFGRFQHEPNTLALADTDADGDLDAWLDTFGGTYFLRNTGAPGAPAFTSEALPFFLAGSEPAFADIDADGDLDWFAGSAFRENTGSASSPALAAAIANPFGLTAPGLRYNALFFVDIDGDGDLDAFIGGRAIVFFENTGNASAAAFSAPLTNPFGLTSVYSYYDSPVFADFDGDGDFDALVGGTGVDLVFFRNTGSTTQPSFSSGVANPFGLFPVGGWVGRARPEAGDLDGDGDLDLIVAELFGRVVFFENVLIDPGACSDGLDNDGDGRIDFGDDPGCASAADTSELSALQCDNGLDDDGDGTIDWRGDGSGDPHCTGLLDDREAPTQASPGCGLGPELLALAPLLAARRRRRGG